MATLDVNLGLVANATGTVNVITATFTPAITTLTEGLKLWVRSTGVNTITGVTFSPNGITAAPLVARGGFALRLSDTGLPGYMMSISYNASTAKWELLNPATSVLLEANTAATSALNAAVGALDAAKKDIATGNAYSFETTDVNGDLQETPVTPSRVVVTDVNGLPTASTATAIEVGYLSGVTSAIQTQLNGKQSTLTNPVTGTGTNNEIAAFNSTGSTITSLSTVTYPSLTELSYVKGLTSPAQTQLNAKRGIILTFFPAAQFNPVDGVVYYFGSNPSTTVQTTSGFGDSIAPVAFTIKSIYGMCFQGAGTNENVAFDIGINGVYTSISSTVQLTASMVEVSVTGLSLSVVAGDNLTIRMTSPTWATNPTNFRASFNVYGE